MTLLLGVLFLAGIGMFLAFEYMPGAVNVWLRQYFLLALCAIFGSVGVFAGTMLKIGRFHLYGALTFAALSAAQFTALPFWLSLTVLGGLITLVGLLILLRFLHENPVIE